MPYLDLKQKLSDRKVVILDGAIGTELERRGVPMNPQAWCGAASINHFPILENVHSDYILAGAEIITTNTYASNKLMLDAAGLVDNFKEINSSAILAARDAINKSGLSNLALAGSLSHRVPYLDEERAPSNQSLESAFNEMSLFLKTEKCDFILLEMMYHPERIVPAFKAGLKTELPLWAGFSARRGKNGEVLSYYPFVDIPFKEIVKYLKMFPVSAAGIMHTPADVIEDALKILKTVFDGPLTAYPDSGYFVSPNWQFKDVISPEKLLEFSRLWVENGVQVLGGCCGLSPEHIKAISILAR